MYDYGARNYDPALGRWMNIDPLAENYYSISPYTFSLNNPIFFLDQDGREIWIYSDVGDQKNKNREKYVYAKDRDYSSMSGFKADAYKALDKLFEASNIKVDGKDVNIMQTIMDSDKELSVVNSTIGESRFSPGRSYANRGDKTAGSYGKDIGTMYFDNENEVMFDDVVNPDKNNGDYFYKQLESGKFNKTTQINSPTSLLGHEIGHAFNFLTDRAGHDSRTGRNAQPVSFGPIKFKNQEEAKTTTLTTQININLGENPRNNHLGMSVPTQGVTSNKLGN